MIVIYSMNFHCNINNFTSICVNIASIRIIEKLSNHAMKLRLWSSCNAICRIKHLYCS